MKTLLKFEEFRLIREAEDNLESFFDSIHESTLNENIGAALGSPVKFTKLKNNAKAYQKALVAKAINNLDFEKKVAAGTLDPKQKDVLAAANKQKNQALQDEVTAIGQRMDQLATTGGLKAVSSMAKNKSQMAAAQIAAKTADGEEAKALKLKIQGLNKKIAASQEELEDYKDKADDEQNLDKVKTDSGETIGDQKEKEAKAKADEEKAKADEELAKKAESAQKVIDNAKVALDKAKEGDDETAKINAEIGVKKAQIKKAELEENDEVVKGLNNDIAELEKKKSEMPKVAEPKEAEPAEPKEAEPKEAEPKEAEPTEPKEAEPKEEEPKEEEPKESLTYIGESIADRFRHLMLQRLK